MMKNKLKVYKKPTLEVVEVQWRECVATSGGDPFSREVRVRVNSGASSYSFVFGDSETIGTDSWSTNF